MVNRPSPLSYLYLFDHALEQEIGIAFTVTGIPRRHFTNELRKARKMTDDPKYSDLIIFEPAEPCAHEVFICKKAVEIDDVNSLG